MRDGEFLEADIFVPTGAKTAEVVLVQTIHEALTALVPRDLKLSDL